ncbi:MAG: hypothetical protein C4346_19640 [Chloroflexota bacterium]
MAVDTLIATPEALGAVMGLVILAFARANCGFLRDIAHDPEASWRVIAWLATISGSALLAWISVFDNVRQLIAWPYRSLQRFPSRRFEFDPPAHEIRVVTLILLLITLVMMAALFARHVGGYPLQVLLAFCGAALWLPLFVLRLRLNLNLAAGFSGQWTSPVDVVAYVAFVVLAWAVEIGVIASAFVALVAAVALPITLVLDVLHRRHPRPTNEATPFFSALERRARESSR